MKATMLTAVILVFAVFTSNARTKTVEKSTTEFGTYEMSSTQEAPLVIKKSKGEYVIHYSDMEAPVYVSVVKEKNCKLYLVRTWGYELQYICNQKEFGVQLMDKKYAKIDYAEMLEKINKDAFRYQRVITTKSHSDTERVELIACFLPEVLG